MWWVGGATVLVVHSSELFFARLPVSFASSSHFNERGNANKSPNTVYQSIRKVLSPSTRKKQASRKNADQVCLVPRDLERLTPS